MGERTVSVATEERDLDARLRWLTQGDRVLHLFGMEVEEAREGFARVTAVVREEFLNAHDIAHGALIFALLDVAFAVAVNSVADAVGVQWSINLFRPGMLGDRLVAECSLIHRGRSMLVVDYRVTNGGGKVLATGQATALPVDRRAFQGQESTQPQP